MNNQHTLSIRLMPGGFCFSTGDSEPSFVNVAPGADYEQRLKDEILSLGVNVGEDEMECFVETSRMSLSPASLEESLSEDMFRLTLRYIESPEKILHETSQDGDVRISFGINSDLYNFLVRTYQFINFHHPIIDLLDRERRTIRRGDNWMTACVSQGSIILLAFKEKKFQLANCSETMVTQNRAYHLLNTWTNLNFDVLNDSLYILGTEPEVNNLKSVVAKFIKNLF